MPETRTVASTITQTTFSVEEIKHALCATYRFEEAGAQLSFVLVDDRRYWSGMPFDDGPLPQKVGSATLQYDTKHITTGATDPAK